MSGRFYIETLGCPKNQVDSEKLVGSLARDGMQSTDDPATADLVVVNTCAFIEAARQESIDTVLALDERRAAHSRLVVTGCMAERYGDELAAALPEVDQVAGFGVGFVAASDAAAEAPGGAGVPNRELTPQRRGRRLDAAAEAPGGAGVPNRELTPQRRDRRSDAAAEAPRDAALTRKLIPVSSSPLPAFDLLNLPRPKSAVPWAYVKIAEGCDRHCGFCAIPSFRGKQRSRDVEQILVEVDELDAREIVLVAQDLASYGKDRPDEPGHAEGAEPFRYGAGAIVPLVRAVAERTDRVRLLYLYPSDLSDALIDTICDSGVPYFDLSLQHVSKRHLRRMRRWGDGERFLRRIADIRAREPEAAFRSNFIVGYPGETEDDHDQLLRFVEAAQLDWCGFFAYSREDGTYAAGLDGQVDASLMNDRLAELTELQDAITASRRDDLIGATLDVLVDRPGIARSHREAPEIDGVVMVDDTLDAGEFAKVEIADALGCDLIALGASDAAGHALDGL